MSSMNENLLDKIARADFSMETDFKSVLRKRLFESGANKISDENGKHTAAVHKTVHSGFFRVRKGLSGHKPSFLLYFWEGRGIICRKCVEQHH